MRSFKLCSMIKQCLSLNGHSYNVLNISRGISVSATPCMKKVVVETEGKVTTVEAVYVEDEVPVLKLDNPKGYCSTCPQKLGFDIQYTDVLLISQFVRPDGTPLPARVTGLCDKAQRRMKIMVHKAQRAGLLRELRPHLGSIEDRPKRSTYKWKKFNSYFDDDDKIPYKI